MNKFFTNKFSFTNTCLFTSNVVLSTQGYICKEFIHRDKELIHKELETDIKKLFIIITIIK